ncbi:MAG TPA: DUF4346 domain-containing protein [Candidatus Nanoarchaeia archaeon]|nr:DUF4346 domain-containing protein [Candidatus Nanoarchaeia archaeon]
MKSINASGYKQDWKLDPKGYFLIRVDEKSKLIEVAHCIIQPKHLEGKFTKNEPDVVIKGKNPEEIIYKIIDLGLISIMDHAAYLGKEVQKAFDCLHSGKEYVQDSDIE